MNNINGKNETHVPDAPHLVEIERKWRIKGLPGNLEHVAETRRRNIEEVFFGGKPQIRARKYAEEGKKPWFELTFKGKKRLNGVLRSEINLPLDELQGMTIFAMCPHMPITMLRDYHLMDSGETVEIVTMDPGLPTENQFAEVEFSSLEASKSYEFPFPECDPIEVTNGKSGFVGKYDFWKITRIFRFMSPIANDPKLSSVVAAYDEKYGHIFRSPWKFTLSHPLMAHICKRQGLILPDGSPCLQDPSILETYRSLRAGLEWSSDSQISAVFSPDAQSDDMGETL